MTKKFVRLMAFAAALMMLLLTACQAAPASTSTPAPAASTGSDATSTPADAGDMTWDSPDISWRQDTSPVTMSMYIDYDWYAVDTWGNDDVSKKIEELTGVSLDVTKGTDLEQLQILLATDMLPDLIFTENNITRFENPDICYPWNELIAEYAPEFVNLVDPVEVANNTAADGNYYTFKTHYISNADWEREEVLPSNGSPILFYREDIMEALGNPTLETFDDLMNVFGMVKEQYPDMQVYLPAWSWDSPLQQMMGLADTKELYLKEDGTVSFGLSQEGLFDYYMLLNEMLKAGYITNEVFTLQSEQWQQFIYAGTVFSAARSSWVQDSFNAYYDDNGIEGKFVPLTTALALEDGSTPYVNYDNGIGWSSTFISKKCATPDRAIKFMEFLKSPEGDRMTQWGVEGLHWEATPEGLPKYLPGYETIDEVVTGIGAWYFQASGAGEGIRDYASRVNSPEYSTRVDALQFIKSATSRNPALYFAMPLADTDEMTTLINLVELSDNAPMNVIMAETEEEARAAFDQMQADAEAMGLSALEAYMTEAYNVAAARYANAG